MGATIKEIAQAAGVSIGTVDRVLHNRSGVNAVTARLVREVAEKLKYSPNTAAKALRLQQKPLRVGVMLNESAYNVFAAKVLEGVQSAYTELRQMGLDLLPFYMSSHALDEQLDLLERAEKASLDGLIIRPVNHPKVADKISALVEKGVRVLSCVSDIQSSGRFCFVGTDEYLEGRKTASLLSKLVRGRIHFAVITGSLNMLNHYNKVLGVQDYFSEKFPDTEHLGILDVERNVETAISLLKALQKTKPLNALLIQSMDRRRIEKICQSLDQREMVVCAFGEAGEMQALVQSGVLSFALDENPFLQGETAMKTLFEALFHKQIPKDEHVRIPTPIIVDV